MSRPRVTGGVRKSTQKRYRAVFDKFVPFATVARRHCLERRDRRVSQRVCCRFGKPRLRLQDAAQRIDDAQAGHQMDDPGWPSARREAARDSSSEGRERASLLLSAGRGPGDDRILPQEDNLHWLADLIIALACTGLRISELASLRWSDLDLEAGRLKLTDETGPAQSDRPGRRELKSGRSRSFPIHPDLRDRPRSPSPHRRVRLPWPPRRADQAGHDPKRVGAGSDQAAD